MANERRIRAFSNPHADYYELTENFGTIIPKGAVFVDWKENGRSIGLVLCDREDGKKYSCPEEGIEGRIGGYVVLSFGFVESGTLVKVKDHIPTSEELALKTEIYNLEELLREKKALYQKLYCS